MSNLNSKQFKFTRAEPLLMLYAQYIGYELTNGDAYRDDRCRYGHDNSTHRFRLAKDFNIFKDGIYLKGSDANKAFALLHDFWDMLGGSKRIKSDMRHFSFKHNGIR